MTDSEPQYTANLGAASTLAEQNPTEAPRYGLEHLRIKDVVRGALFGSRVDPDPVRIGRFTIVRRLGAGGMGVVYSAFDDELERKVAIKLLRSDRQDAQGRARMLREAQAIARLAHPNVVPMFEIGEHDGQVFLAMEFVHGVTLRQWLNETTRTWREIRDVFMQAGSGLAAAHAAGLVHRDFKPDNVMVGEDGRVRVLDFGLAEILERRTIPVPAPAESSEDLEGDPAGETRLTATGAVLGTPAYMAPEQHQGLPTDARTDQFAFAITMWEALWHERPFGGRTQAELAQATIAGRIRESPTGSAVPNPLREALAGALQPEPDQRFSSMETLLHALSIDPSARRRRVFVGVGGVALLVGGVGLGSTLAAEDPDTECPPADRELARVWSASHRSRAQAALAASDAGLSLKAWSQVADRIDAYALQWSATYTGICGNRALDSQQRLERRLCLQWSLQELSSLTDALVAGDVSAIATAPGRVEALGSPDACTDEAEVRSRSEARAMRSVLAPAGVAAGVISDFEHPDPSHGGGRYWARFGIGWQGSTDGVVGGKSEVELLWVEGGAEQSKGALRMRGIIRGEGNMTWAGAIFFPGELPFKPANLASKRVLTFWARGKPGDYAVLLFVQRRGTVPLSHVIMVGETWTHYRVDLTALVPDLYDVTGIFIGDGDEAHSFDLDIDEVALE